MAVYSAVKPITVHGLVIAGDNSVLAKYGPSPNVVTYLISGLYISGLIFLQNFEP